MEFSVALPLAKIPLDEYNRAFAEKDSIRKFCTRRWPEDSDIYRFGVKKIRELQDICLYIDLTDSLLAQNDEDVSVIILSR